ncbi:MAG: polyprenyl synthetase family protein [Bacteroidales bacterium]|nr:polyprenyl synthetase family protein [Bacteroidales bacterium]
MYTLEEIDGILAKFARLQNVNREPANLYAPLDYMMSIGGKRIRPKLCLLTANLLRDDLDKDVIFPAMALEVFHEFTLIHDDIMDRSDTRRGCPTVYKKWNEEIAILSGDAMSILAYKYLACAPQAVLPQALDLFSTTALEVCEGQQYDMDFENLPFITMDDYLMMIGLKTAVLIACAAKMGALLGGAEPAVAQTLYDFGYQLGIAFQITDDYLDTFGNEKVFGKKIGGDIVNNKKTWLLVECLRRASAEQKQELERLMRIDGTVLREEKVGAVRDLYEALGVKAAAEQEILAWHDKAIRALDSAGIAPERLTQLKRFTEELIHREK